MSKPTRPFTRKSERSAKPMAKVQSSSKLAGKPMTNKNTQAPLKGKAGLHPRNQHKGNYDFPALCKTLPEL
ncbi:MAG: RlmF-related methyltransferase, partial [Amylibacter sp.]